MEVARYAKHSQLSPEREFYNERENQHKKRMLAMMMAIVMVMTLLPTSALAAGGDTGLQEGQVRATKALVLNDENQPAVDAEGYYTVQITVQGKPKQAENGSNADVVLVVDNSGSMSSSVGEPCNTPKDQFAEKNEGLWYSYTCPNCGAEYSKTLFWDTRPEYCTGQKGNTPRIDAAKDVSKEFANSILAEGTDNKLAVIGFAHNKDNGGVDDKALTVSQELTTDKSLIDTKIDQMKADGGTNYTAALAKAQEYLNNRTDTTRPGYVIFISDGAPGRSGDSLNDSNWNGSTQIEQLKTAGITVYTVGIALEADAENYLKNMASENQDEHFINVSTTKYKDEMSAILQTWATKINSIPAGRDATITDVVNTGEFEYKMENTPKVTNDTATGTITWDIGEITEEPQSIQFKVKPKNGKYGTLYTNNSVTLSYTDCEGQNQQIQDTKDMTTEPKIGNPYIEIANPARAYTVEYYYDDVKGDAPAGAPTGSTANVSDTVTIIAGDSADATHFPKQTTVGTENYAFDEGAANVLNTTIVEDATKNVLKVHYAKDENGNGTPDYKETKYTITYAAGTEDTTVSGIPAKVDNVLAGTEQTVSSEKPTREGYTFSRWTTTDVEVKDDKTFTMPEKNVTFTAQWTANDVTITFDANGGAWAADVAGYTMNADKTKASKTYKPSDVVTKISTDPVQAGKTFNGWYIMVSGKKEPVVWTSFIKAQLIHQHGGVIYADWTGAAPAGQCTYTTRQHYINEKGVEELAVNIMVQSAEKGTKISDLIKHLENNQTYYGQNYFYDRTKTTVNDDAYNAETMTLDTDGKAIDLYYYLDEWGGKDDETPGDNIPDCQQAVVNFLADPNGSVGKKGEKTTQVFTLKKGDDGKYSDSVTPANVTPIPKENFVFDIWTKDNGETGVNPFVAQTLNGGDKVTYTAHFAADKIGSENKPDNIPDKYQAVVTYKVVGGTWKDGKTDDQVQVFTLKTKNKETGVWEDVTPAPTLGNTIPTGMISSYSRTASQSWDKDITKDTKVTESVTYTYTFTKKSSGGGGGGGSHKPTVTIPDDVPTGLNGDDHYAYIVGYPDSTVRPQNGITRAEVATIFFRLLTDETRTANATKTNNYADVSSDKWYNQAVSTLSAMGIIKGDSRGNFNPNAPITRAEFAAIAARFDKTEDVAAASFGDVATHWAKPEISVAANNGWINGYTDGTFHPDSRITRAEAMAMINRVLQRLPESKADLLDGMIQWSDNADTSKWYYLAVQEATNSHYYELKANQHEKWTKLRENRDWTELEK